MRVDELRAALVGLPDDMPVLIYEESSGDAEGVGSIASAKVSAGPLGGDYLWRHAIYLDGEPHSDAVYGAILIGAR
jgi:hypothetical protein